MRDQGFPMVAVRLSLRWVLKTRPPAPGIRPLSSVDFFYPLANGGWNQVFPGLSARNRRAHFRGGNMAEFPRQFHGTDSRLEFLWRYILAATRRYQQVKLPQHLAHGAGTAVVPVDDSLGGIAPAQKSEGRIVAVSRAALRGHLHEESATRCGDGKPWVFGGNRAQQFHSLCKGCTAIRFMGKHARQDVYHFVNARKRRARKRHMRHRNRIERAGKDSQPGRHALSPPEELHSRSEEH